MECTITGKPYTIFGYKGKQVRDNIHSHDLIAAFDQFYRNPRSGEIYNMGGSRYANCSMLEAIGLCEEIAGKKSKYTYTEDNRSGDHIWYISDVSKFQRHYPNWTYKYNLRSTLEEIYRAQVQRVRHREHTAAGVSTASVEKG
jgi:CDP-paratose 2-epimerase